MNNYSSALHQALDILEERDGKPADPDDERINEMLAKPPDEVDVDGGEIRVTSTAGITWRFKHHTIDERDAPTSIKQAAREVREEVEVVESKRIEVDDVVVHAATVSPVDRDERWTMALVIGEDEGEYVIPNHVPSHARAKFREHAREAS